LPPSEKIVPVWDLNRPTFPFEQRLCILVVVAVGFRLLDHFAPVDGLTGDLSKKLSRLDYETVNPFVFSMFSCSCFIRFRFCFTHLNLRRGSLSEDSIDRKI